MDNNAEADLDSRTIGLTLPLGVVILGERDGLAIHANEWTFDWLDLKHAD